MHRHPFAAAHAALIDDGAERGGKPAAEAGGGGVVEIVGQMHQVLVGIVDCDIFGERAPMGEARLELVRTDLWLPEWHSPQRPQPETNGTVTRSPTL